MVIRDIEEFIGYWKRIRERTFRVVDLIPTEQLEWAPAPNRFSLGDLVRHLGAAERYMFAENVRFRPSRYPGHGPELARGYESVRSYLAERHRESLKLFREIESGDLERRCRTPAGAEIPVWKWLRAMVEHEVHHRGQLYLMLGLLGVKTPPLYGLTSEEVREHSEPL